MRSRIEPSKRPVGRRPLSPALAALLAGLLASGCSLFRPVAPPPPPPVAPPPAPPELPTPTAMHKFVVDGASGDVVGRVQKTLVGPEDTLPDIARRFDVGYEEILLANPGV